MHRRIAILAVLSAVIGTAMTVGGSILTVEAGQLHDRTGRVVATVMDGQLEFTTIAGNAMEVPLQDDCKLAEPPPARGCL